MLDAKRHHKPNLTSYQPQLLLKLVNFSFLFACAPISSPTTHKWNNTKDVQTYVIILLNLEVVCSSHLHVLFKLPISCWYNMVMSVMKNKFCEEFFKSTNKGSKVYLQERQQDTHMFLLTQLFVSVSAPFDLTANLLLPSLLKCILDLLVSRGSKFSKWSSL